MKNFNIDSLVNLWLEKYHNTNIDKVLDENPLWRDDPNKYSRVFYEKYKVTQEQHDEWEKEAKELTIKQTKYSKKYLNRVWWSIYLNCSPTINQTKI